MELTTLLGEFCCCEVTRLSSRLILVEYVTSLGFLRQYQLYFRDSDVCKFVCMYACMYITAFASIPSNRNRGYFLFRAEATVSLVSFAAARAGVMQRSPSPRGCFKPTYIPFSEINQSMCGFHFLANVRALNFNQSPGSFYLTR